MSASATMNAASAPYCAALLSAVAAARLANQLTTMKPPSTTSQLTLIIASAMGLARPVEKSTNSAPANARMAPSRWT